MSIETYSISIVYDECLMNQCSYYHSATWHRKEKARLHTILRSTIYDLLDLFRI
jgi:hypothetical protein